MSFYAKLWRAWLCSIGLAIILIVAIIVVPNFVDLPTWLAIPLAIAVLAAPFWLADKFACPSCGSSVWGTPSINRWGMWFAIAPPRRRCRSCSVDFVAGDQQ